MLSIASSSRSALIQQGLRYASTTTAPLHHRIVIVGGGTAGVTVAAQLEKAYKSEKRPLNKGDIAIIEPSELHHYQPGWTLVGSGLGALSDMVTPTSEVIPSGTTRYATSVSTFSPKTNQISTSDGLTISYDALVVSPGLSLDWNKIPGLNEGLADASSGITSIYSPKSAEQTWKNIQNLKSGKAIFTQPAGIVKCAGAPQKIMWMANSTWKKSGLREAIQPLFASGAATMFSVPKYSDALEKLRVERNVDGLLNHNLISINPSKKIATFSTPTSTNLELSYDLLHVVPPQKPHEFISSSPLADSTGWVSVNPATLQHNNFINIFGLGDSAALPTSKTMAAISAQAPVVVDNLRAVLDGQECKAIYDGYTSCPLLTGHNELMLCEFKYGAVPSESFAWLFGSQDKPNAFYYFLKKAVFPRVYWMSFLKGTWFGPKTILRPIAYMKE